MNRIDRISAILIHLQSRRIVKAEQIAERFGVSLRTIYRDVKAIQEAGVPILSEPGIGYSIMEGYRMPPIQFTKEEAAAFLTAEKLIEKLTDHGMDQSFSSAMYKVRAVLRSSDQVYLETIEEVIRVKDNPYLPKSDTSQDALRTLLDCIYQKCQVRISYFAGYSQKESQRIIEPIGVVFISGNWLVIAYCQLRKDYRSFRVDRIKKLMISNHPFQAKHPCLDSFLTSIAKEKKLTRTIIKTKVENLPYLGDQKYYHGFVSQRIEEDYAYLTFLTSSLQGFARWYLMLGDYTEILEPLSLKQICMDIIEKTLPKLKT